MGCCAVGMRACSSDALTMAPCVCAQQRGKQSALTRCGGAAMRPWWQIWASRAGLLPCLRRASTPTSPLCGSPRSPPPPPGLRILHLQINVPTSAKLAMTSPETVYLSFEGPEVCIATVLLACQRER